MTEQTEMEPTRYRKISEGALRVLLQESAELNALQNGGVDNWEWYSESLHDSPDWNEDECEFNVEESLNQFELIGEEPSDESK